jgi:uncharacterized protein YjiS (DUF1127 family)
MFATLSLILRIGAWCEAITGFFFRRSAMTSLRALDNRALRDIGIARSEIEAAVDGLVSLRAEGRR